MGLALGRTLDISRMEADGFGLNVLALTDDEQLLRSVGGVCDDRGHWLQRIGLLRDLAHELSRARPNVLLLDKAPRLADNARLAATVAAIHHDLAIVLVGDGSHGRSEGGFRVVDRWRTGERIVDELELAHIGIPASVRDAFPELRS